MSGEILQTEYGRFSGYDFGYFLKLLTALSLPTTEEAFFERLRKWFPISYDMKTMMRVAKGLRGGLQEVADDLGVSAPSLPLPKSPAQLTRVLHLKKTTRSAR
jgi:hypothetical protein